MMGANVRESIINMIKVNDLDVINNNILQFGKLVDDIIIQDGNIKSDDIALISYRMFLRLKEGITYLNKPDTTVEDEALSIIIQELSVSLAEIKKVKDNADK